MIRMKAQGTRPRRNAHGRVSRAPTGRRADAQTYARRRTGADAAVDTLASPRDNVGVTAITQRRPTVRERIILRTRGTLMARDPLTALDELQALRAELDAYEKALVYRALGSGTTFAAVARSLGISRQAAHRRYRDEFSARNRSL
jgi:hypothetical protein